MGGSARLTHMPVDVAIFLWHIGSIYLFLMAAWRLLLEAFALNRAPGAVGRACCRWLGAGRVPGVRDGAGNYGPVSYAAIVCGSFGVVRRGGMACRRALGCGGMGGVHGGDPPADEFLRRGFAGGAVEAGKGPSLSGPTLLGLLPFGYGFEPAQGPAREALLARSVLSFVMNWEWFEWGGGDCAVGFAVLVWPA